LEQDQSNIPAKPGSDSQSDQKKTEKKKSGRYYRPKKHYYKSRKPKSEQTSDNRDSATKRRFSFRKISIIVPLLNEEESIRPLFNEIKKTLSGIGSDYEILFVDDGSTDNSLKIIKELARTENRIKYISFRKNYGKSAALHIGFKNVVGDAIITMDADLQDDPDGIPELLGKLEEGYDLVSGWKKKRYDPIVKKYSSKFFNYVTRVITGINIHDFNCGLKAYRKDVVQNIDVHGELHRYIPVLADWKGFRITELVVTHHPRRYGKTKFGISRFFKGFVDLITVVFTTRYIKRPMHLFGLLGALSFLAGSIVNAYLSYEWLFKHKFLSNRPLLFLGILLIIVGVQFFSVGLLGELMVHNKVEESDYNIKEKNK
jgi:glycosyltransferase involved in cell wall biosynthesis